MAELDRDEQTTKQLVIAARSGDRQAFGVLVERYQEGVYAFMLGRTADPERSQELTQDAFVKALTTIEKLEKPESFKSWVIGIAHNLSRRRKKEIANFELLGAAKDSREQGLDALATTERLDAVRDALTELPEKYRDALMLHYFDKKRGRAIGDALGISEGAVHMTLMRARRALADKLKAFAPEGTDEQ